MIFRCRPVDPAEVRPVCADCRTCVNTLFALVRFGLGVKWECLHCRNVFEFQAEPEPASPIADACVRLCELVSRSAFWGCALTNLLALVPLVAALVVTLCGIDIGLVGWAAVAWLLAGCAWDQFRRARAYRHEYGRWPWAEAPARPED